VTDFRKEFDAYRTRHAAPERIELLLCDINAILRGKWLPGDQADKLAAGQVRLPISTYAPTIMGTEPPETGLGIVAGDPDGFMKPVPGTLKPVPWARGEVAQVLVEMSESAESAGSGEPAGWLSSRRALARMVDRLAAKGLYPTLACELEFYIVRKRSNGDEAPRPPAHLPDAQNYELGVMSNFAEILDDIRHACAAQGLASDTLVAEFGPGQFEINFHHTGDVLVAADTALLFRRLVRGVVARHGLEASFMAKPYAKEPGSGMHVHVSLCDAAGRNIFDAGAQLKRAVAGVLATMREAQALFAPHLNSFRRFQPASFAPSRPDWGQDNRAAAIRLPETTGKGARLEHRICGADVNPYLAIAAILGGIMHGLETDLPLQPPLEDADAKPAEPLDHDWTRAVERCAVSDFCADVLGRRLRDVYVAVKRDEIAALTAEISPVEYRHYLGRF